MWNLRVPIQGPSARKGRRLSEEPIMAGSFCDQKIGRRPLIRFSPPRNGWQLILPNSLSAILVSMRERIGTNLKVDDLGHCAFSRFAMERRACAPCGPHALALPAGGCVVDPPIHAFREESHWIR